MKNHQDSGVISRARRVLMIGVPAVGLAIALVGAAPAQQAFAQSTGGSISIGGDIADTVAAAVSGIATGSSSASGGVSSEHNELNFGDQEGLAVSDASGGNHNASAKQ